MSRFGLSLLLPFVAGCNLLFGLDEVTYTPPGDGGGGDDATDDGKTDSGTSMFGPWGIPVPIPVVNTTVYDETDASMTADSLELMFASNRPGMGGFDIYIATRANKNDDFGTPVAINALNSPLNEFPFMTADGLRVYMSRDSSADPLYSSRATRSSNWNIPAADATGMASTAADTNVEIAANETFAVLQHNTAGEIDLFYTTRDSPTDPVWNTPHLALTELNTTGFGEHSAGLNRDGTIIVIDSTRLGGGIRRLFESSRPDPAQPFSAPDLIDELNNNTDANDPWLSSDARTIIFRRNQDLYWSTR